MIRIIDHPEMSAIAETIVKRLGLSGLCGFDFVIDPNNQAWLIEMNPRLTPICHLPLDDNTDLAAALFLRITGFKPIRNVATIRDSMIALFPLAFLQRPPSTNLSSCYHDVPWEELEFVRACLDRRSNVSLIKQIYLNFFNTLD